MPQPPLTLDQRARHRIRQWIETTGVSQAQLSAQVGKTQGWMSRYLHEEFDADLETLQKMAQVFGHSIISLLDTPSDPDEARFIELFRCISPATRDAIVLLLETFARPPRQRRRSK
jgi:transcriptional regulator with XRE-family HTH domain